MNPITETEYVFILHRRVDRSGHSGCYYLLLDAPTSNCMVLLAQGESSIILVAKLVFGRI
jgi:hypothetical protein